MTEKTKKLLDHLNKRDYRKLRNDTDFMLYELDDFGFNRRCPRRINGSQGNVTPNYKRVLELGFNKIKDQINSSIGSTADEQKNSLRQADDRQNR